MARRASTVIALPTEPLSPWLRLAHVTRVGPRSSGRGRLRTIDDYMLMLQLEGTSFIWWEAARGSVALAPGSIAFVPPGSFHAWGECQGAHIAVHFDLHADPRLQPDAMQHHVDRTVAPKPLPAVPLIELAPPTGDPLRIPLVTGLRRPGWWQERLQPLIDMYKARRHRGAAERLRAAEILSWAVADLASAQTTTVQDPRIQRALFELDRDLARPWRIGALARRAGMGEVAFRRAFLRATGSGPRAHLEGLRIDRAADLLVASDRPVADIGAEVGFADAYHFSRVFRRRMGMPPRAFRERGTR